MNNSHHPAIELNNIAVAEMDNGNNLDAITNLKKALAIAKRCWSNTPDHELVVVVGDENDCNKAKRKTSLDDFVSSSRSGSATAFDEDTNNRSSFLYRQAIHLEPDAIGRDNRSRQQLSAVIVFNLALAHHLIAETDETQQYNCFTMRAAKLYELSWQLVQREVGYNSPLFMMVIVNNLGVAYQSLGEVENAQRSFEHLLSTMLFLMDCGHHHKIFAKATKNHSNLQEGFFRNVSPLFLHQSTAAAA